MSDLRRSAASPSHARAALIALVAALCIGAYLVGAPSAGAVVTGDLHQLVDPGFDGGKLSLGGPIAVDPDAGNVYTADLDGSFQPRVQKFSQSGTLLGSVPPDTTNASGNALYVAGIALDPDRGLLYVLMDADDNGGASATAREILVYSTTPSGGALVKPATGPGSTDGVLVDFRTAGHGLDYATGIAVDPGTHKVAVLGIDDITSANPVGRIQYVSDQGAIDTTVADLGAGLDPVSGSVSDPAGLAIAPNGDVYVGVLRALTTSNGSTGDIYRLPRETGTSTLFVSDDHEPQFTPFVNFGFLIAGGSPIAISRDGETLYVAEGNANGLRVRGYSTDSTDGTPEASVVYGKLPAGDSSAACAIPNGGAGGLAAGDGHTLAVLPQAGPTYPGPVIHIFGDGGTGCPQTQGLFTVNDQGTGTVTVVKGRPVSFDASASDLLGATATQLDWSWDFDASADFTTHVPALTTTHKFLSVGTFQVGVVVHSDGSPPTEAVFHQVKVIGATPSAAFKASNTKPGPGAVVTFDAGDSLDPAGSDGNPTHALAKYQWDFGDGQTQVTTTATASHSFANAATAALSRTVKLVVVTADGVVSTPVQQTLTVAGTPATAPPDTNTNTTNNNQPPPQQPVVTPPTPTLSAPTVDSKGATIGLKIVCPAGGASCTGKITLTVKVKTKVKGKTKTTTITLGSATFMVIAGKTTSVKLKLSSTGKALLKKQRKLSASAVVAVTAGGTTKTTSKSLTLKAPAKKK